MVTLAQELLGRLVQLSNAEAGYARNRLPEDKPPTPKVGDRVYFRREAWASDEDLFPMRVVEVQDPNDTTSEFATNLCQHLRHHITGGPLFFPDGKPVVVPLPDPWPWIKMVWDGEPPATHEENWKHRVQMTFESRMRGSPGWLPMNYVETRQIRYEGDIPYVPMPSFRFNGERLEVDYGDGQWLPYPQR
ncbi:MAG TPA: hypothetical protein VIY48_17550 [Candidatus Paceibacterota bacterium]